MWSALFCACVKIGRYKDSLIGEMDGCEVILNFFVHSFSAEKQKIEQMNMTIARVQGLL